MKATKIIMIILNNENEYAAIVSNLLKYIRLDIKPMFRAKLKKIFELSAHNCMLERENWKLEIKTFINKMGAKISKWWINYLNFNCNSFFRYVKYMINNNNNNININISNNNNHNNNLLDTEKLDNKASNNSSNDSFSMSAGIDRIVCE